MSNVRGDDAALEHELFGMLSKAKDCGLSRVNRLREKYRIFERHVVFDMIWDLCREEIDDFLLTQEVERISDVVSKFHSHTEEIIGRIYFWEMSINGQDIDEIEASLSKHM